jgi:antitoxin (DNA-binding transcriptional repressor) of toxin-antitoxin stability system
MASFAALQEAQEKLAELIDRAKGGEEIVIERDGKAAAKLVAVPGGGAAEGAADRRAEPAWDYLYRLGL